MKASSIWGNNRIRESQRIGGTPAGGRHDAGTELIPPRLSRAEEKDRLFQLSESILRVLFTTEKRQHTTGTSVSSETNVESNEQTDLREDQPVREEDGLLTAEAKCGVPMDR